MQGGAQFTQTWNRYSIHRAGEEKLRYVGSLVVEEPYYTGGSAPIGQTVTYPAYENVTGNHVAVRGTLYRFTRHPEEGVCRAHLNNCYEILGTYTSTTIGDYIDTIVAPAGTYPSNGQSGSYWYILS